MTYLEGGKPLDAKRTDNMEPFVGPRPFERADEEIFNGRETEADEVYSLIVANPAVLLYSPSGAGKTSLLNAKIIPSLEKDGFDILPSARVQGLVSDEVEGGKTPNIYTANALLSWDNDPKRKDSLIRQTIVQYLAGRETPSPKWPDRQCVAVFDQFEELFTFFPNRWQDREQFLSQIGEALKACPLLRVVFSMREDFVAELDPYLHLLPENLRVRFRLERLRETEAIEAIIRPIEKTDHKVEEAFAKKLVKSLLHYRVQTGTSTIEVVGEFVEPVQLQVVCQRLWKRLEKGDAIDNIADDVAVYGDVNSALEDFYNRAIAQTIANADIDERTLRSWIERKLITPAGTRSTVFRGGQRAEGIPNSIIDELVNQYVIRGESRGGGHWYELTHDRFIQPIIEANRKWLQELRGDEKEIVNLQTKAQDWEDSNRDPQYYLRSSEISEAERLLNKKSDPAGEESNALKSLIRESKAKLREKGSRRLSVALSLIAFLIIVILVVWIRILIPQKGMLVRNQASLVEKQDSLLAKVGQLNKLTAALTDRNKLLALLNDQSVMEKATLRQQKKELVDALAKKEAAETHARISTRRANQADQRADSIQDHYRHANDLMSNGQTIWHNDTAAAAGVFLQAEAEFALIRDSAGVARASLSAGVLLTRLKKFKEAEEQLNRAVDITNTLFVDAPLRLVVPLRTLAYLRIDEKEYLRADSSLINALTIMDKSADRDTNELLVVLSMLGNVLEELGEWRRALTYGERYVAIRQNSGTNTNDLAVALRKNAGRHLECQMFAESDADADRALYLHSQEQMIDSVEKAELLRIKAVIRRESGSLSEAVDFYNDAMKLNSRGLKFSALIYGGLGRVEFKQGKWNEAESDLRKSLDILEKPEIRDSGSIVFFTAQLSMVYYSQERYTEAESLYDRIAANLGAGKGRDLLMQAEVMEAHAKLLKATGMETQADFWAAKAIAAKKKYETFCTLP